MKKIIILTLLFISFLLFACKNDLQCDYDNFQEEQIKCINEMESPVVIISLRCNDNWFSTTYGCLGMIRDKKGRVEYLRGYEFKNNKIGDVIK